MSLLFLNNLVIGYNNSPLSTVIDFKLSEGEKVLICGPNGSGKSTLLKTILGIIKPVKGEVLYTGKNHIAYCKQDALQNDFPITAEEVVKTGLYKNKKSEEFVYDCMKKTGCLELKDRLFFTLSGGEKQRVSLARCLCQSSSLLLLDEPSSYLDASSKETFIELLQKMSGEPVGIIGVTHDSDVINSLGWEIIQFEKWSVK